jgi:AraC-like DNA-binding protein
LIWKRAILNKSSAKAGLPGLILPFGQTSGEAAFQQWSETVATVYDLDATRDDIDNFRFGFSAWHFGSLVLGVSETDKIKFWRSPQTVARSGIDHYLVQVYEQGGFGSNVEGKDMVVESGDVWIVDLSRSVRNDQASFRSTNLAIPRSVLAPLLPDPDALHGLKLSGKSATGGLLSRYLSDLSKQAKTMSPEEAVSVAKSTVHLIAGCVGPSIEAAGLAREGLGAAVLRNMKSCIDRELANPELGPDYLCKNFAVSRATLYRLFKPYDGVSSYVRQRRLARCFHEIAAPQSASRRISDIAHQWGFTNETSFSHAFRQAFGISPSEARDAARSFSATYEDGAGTNDTDGELSHWLQRLMKF